MSGNPHSDSRYIAGMFVLALVAYTAILLAVFAWHRAGVMANHAAILREIAAMRASLADQYAYIRARDTSWAAELGWPAPPEAPRPGGDGAGG
jgi:hypothetical protein